MGVGLEVGCFCVFSSFSLLVDPYQHSVFILHGLGGSSPLGAFEIEKLLSAQGRHVLWAQKGKVFQGIICSATPCAWVVLNRRDDM